MDHVLKHFLAVALAASAAGGEGGRAPRFYPDDPVASLPDVVSVDRIASRKVDPLADFVRQSVRPERRPATPSAGVNTLGEVPDSSWYTNRHARRRMSLADLRRGPGDANAPVLPFEITGGKTEGITPGFKMRDARGRTYFVKPDPASNPEMATAADVIGSKFFYALGYYTPENYIVRFREGDWKLASDAKVKGVNGKPRRMTKKDATRILDAIPRNADGTMRVVASLALPGEPLGPFKFSGTRSDDPNDVFPHERRRDLRGLHVLSAWLNHTDSKAGNSLDVLVRQDGRSFVRHYLIDFGAMLGSDSDMPKDARFGHEFVLPTGGEALRRMFGFGFAGPEWETVEYPKLKAVGRFSAEMFDPETWKSNYPNPAFLSRTAEDEYWAAKLVMAFRDEEIRAIVETGQYSDPQAVDVITEALIERRDRIGRAYFHKLLALDNFRFEDGEVKFDDLALRHGFAPSRTFEQKWYRFDNETHEATPAAGPRAVSGPYAMVRIANSVSVYLRRNGRGWDVAGVERDAILKDAQDGRFQRIADRSRSLSSQ